MKFVDIFWDHPLLKPFTQRMLSGEWLFHQGEPGNAMYIILQGYVSLKAEKQGKAAVITLLPAGEFLGEQSILNGAPYERAFSAQARTDITVLKLTNADIENIQKQSPALMTDILKGMFGVAATRLQRANHLAQVLRPSKNPQRLVNLILYLCETSGRQFPEGKEVLLTNETVRFYIDMNDFEIEQCLTELQHRQLLIARGNQFYLIPNEQALKASVAILEDSVPHLIAI